MSERIIGSLRARNLHKKPEVLAAAEQTRKLRRFEAGRGESGSEEVENKNFPDPRNPEEIIQNYINGLEAMMTSKHPDALPRKLEKLKQMLYDRCVITTDPALFEGYFTSQAQQARDMGLEYREPIEAEKQQRITSIVEEQKQSLDVWVDYLASNESNYPPEQKYLALSSILKMGVYNPDTHTFSKRYKKTYKPFPDLDSEALGEAMKQIESGATEDFPGAYGETLFRIFRAREERTEQTEQTEQREHIEGEWKFYPQGSDYHDLMNDTAGKGSGWCFATNEYDAKQYTQHGDQWIFYTKASDDTFSIPRIGISVRNGQIFEARGVTKGQGMEGGGIEDIAMAKLKEFPGYEVYLQRTADTQYLADLTKRQEQGEPFTKEDLTFLYEVDATIASFARGQDPRILGLRKGRDVNADMLTIFDCVPDHIAHNPQEVTPNTKAYVGPLYPGIFKKLAHLEHIYMQFPEKKIRSLECAVGGMTAGQLTTAIEDTPEAPGAERKMQISNYSKSMLANQEEFIPTEERKQMRFVRLTVADLGFPNGATFKQIIDKALELGLEYCPPDAGPHLRLHLTNQPMNEWLIMGMEPITGSGRRPEVFRVERSDDGAWLDSDSARPDDHWRAGGAFVFRTPSPEGGQASGEA